MGKHELFVVAGTFYSSLVFLFAFFISEKFYDFIGDAKVSSGLFSTYMILLATGALSCAFLAVWTFIRKEPEEKNTTDKEFEENRMKFEAIQKEEKKNEPEEPKKIPPKIYHPKVIERVLDYPKEEVREEYHNEQYGSYEDTPSSDDIFGYGGEPEDEALPDNIDEDQKRRMDDALEIFLRNHNGGG